MYKKKILIVIPNKFMSRNYFSTNAFKHLNKLGNCHFIIDESVEEKFGKKNYMNFKFRNSELKKYTNLYDSKIFRSYKNSKSFELHKKIYLSFNKWIDSDHEKILKKIITFPVRLILFLKNIIKYIYLTLNLFAPIRDFFEKKIKVNQNLESKIASIKPDLIILPTKASDIYYFDLKKISDKHKIKLLFLVDNWDNVSAKSVMYNNCFYGVWGKQSYAQVKKIHKISNKNTFIIGTPRLENFFRNRNTKLKRHYKFKYFLFLENTYPTEIIALSHLDKIISQNSIFKKYKIVYRPHPWRKGKFLINLNNFKNVIIDNQMKANFLKNNFSSSSQPNLDYYPSLLKNSELIISGPTTMVLESLIFRKKVLLLGFENSESPYSPANLLRSYEHFTNIKQFKNIQINNQITALEEDFKKIYFSYKEKDKITDKKINFYIYNDAKEYSKRLYLTVKKILNT